MTRQERPADLLVARVDGGDVVHVEDDPVTKLEVDYKTATDDGVVVVGWSQTAGETRLRATDEQDKQLRLTTPDDDRDARYVSCRIDGITHL